MATISQTKAPKKDQIKGSSRNKVGSASSKKSSVSINFSESITNTLINKKDEYNKKHPNSKVSLGTLKAVFRRGAGAFSSSHRPGMSRSGWAFARVNKFLLKKGGTKVKAAYVQDDDLMANGGFILNEYKFLKKDYGFYNDYFGEFHTYNNLDNVIGSESNYQIKLNPYNESGKDAFLYLEGVKQKYIELDFISIDNNIFRGKRLGEILMYLALIDLKYYGIGIISLYNSSFSDSHRTQDAEKMWGRLMQNEKYKINKKNDDYYINLSADTIINIDINEEIVYKNGGELHSTFEQGGLIAPNGAKSNLTPEQYRLVRTTEFKAWFGDWEKNPEKASKVIDKNGEPLVVYHGTKKDFTIFKSFYEKEIRKGEPLDYEIGNHFGTIQQAKDRGYKILPFFLNIKNLIRTHDKGNWIVARYKEIFSDLDITIPQLKNYPKIINGNEYEYVLSNLKKNKIDGFIYKNTYEGNRKDDSYIVFEPSQIKLADGTNNTFDMNNPDIRYNEGGEIGQKIICVKCGWGWNTNNSDESDKYVCHNCGFDNRTYYDADPIGEYNNGGVIDLYTNKEIKKAYVSIKILNSYERNPNTYELEIVSKDTKVYDELANHKLIGIEGVSTSRYNVADWLSSKQCLVLMKFDEFRKINNVEQVLYNDADYLTKNGLDVMYRLYDQKGKDDRDYNSILQKMFPKIAREFQIEGIIYTNYKYKLYSLLEEFFTNYSGGKFLNYFTKQERVNSVKDIVNIVIEYIESGEAKKDYYSSNIPNSVNAEDIEYIIRNGIINALSIYKDESEWIVKDKILNIPNGSQLIFRIEGIDAKQKKIYEENIAKYNLEDTYKINFVNTKYVEKFSNIKSNAVTETYKSALLEKKSQVDSKIIVILQEIINNITNYINTNLVIEISNYFSNPYYDYNDSSIEYGENPLDIPKYKEFYEDAKYKFVELFNAEIDNIVKNKQKYYFDTIMWGYQKYIKDLKDESINKDKVIVAIDNSGYDVLEENFYDILYGIVRRMEITDFTSDIKEKIGSDLYRAFGKDEINFKEGGKVNNEFDYYDGEKIEKTFEDGGIPSKENIALPDAYSNIENLKRVLNNQGYEIIESVKNKDILETGGMVVGKSHKESDENGTGEKFKIKTTGQVVELEGGEAVIVGKAIDSDDKLEFNGEKMSPREIASFLNNSYGGVKFEKGGQITCGCSHKKYYHGGELPTAVVHSLQGGEAVITKKTMESKDKYEFEGEKLTPRQILSRVNHRYGGVSFAKGGKLEKFTNDPINIASKMIYFVNNIIYG
jgi:hypothetical protein